jgi:hypothetical protein
MATIAARVIHLNIDRDRFTRSGYIGRFQAKNETHERGSWASWALAVFGRRTAGSRA